MHDKEDRFILSFMKKKVIPAGLDMLVKKNRSINKYISFNINIINHKRDQKVGKIYKHIYLTFKIKLRLYIYFKNEFSKGLL